MSSLGGDLPFVSYHSSSGADEVLRPTLIAVSDGRCYRKMTGVPFGPERKEANGQTFNDSLPVHPFNGIVIIF